MSRRKLYWICQTVGWTAYEGYEMLFTAVQTGRWNIGVVINGLTNVILGIAITHAYRLIINRLSWLDLPLYQLLPRILFSVFVMAVLMVAVNIPLDLLTLENVFFSTPVILLGILNWMRNLQLWSLLYHTFQYFERSRNNQVEKIRLASANREFEARLLRSQLNPHFVFNALNSIRALVFENPEKAQQSITQLSRLLRNSLVADRHKTIPLEEELKTVQDYLELEKIRYEDRLSIKTEIDPAVLKIQVPPLILQTLVENAIKHGVSKPVGGGFVAIQARQQNGHLQLIIRNTGRLEKSQDDGTGFGLLSTQQRLGLIYGEKNASFQIHQESEEVVCAELQMPV
jgi:two-component system, LytTR family, sensor kinase